MILYVYMVERTTIGFVVSDSHERVVNCWTTGLTCHYHIDQLAKAKGFLIGFNLAIQDYHNVVTTLY